MNQREAEWHIIGALREAGWSYAQSVEILDTVGLRETARVLTMAVGPGPDVPAK